MKGDQVLNNTELLGDGHSALHINDITDEDLGKYVCIAENSAGSARISASLLLHEPIDESITDTMVGFFDDCANLWYT
jgi:hypothetical protein